MQRRKSFFRWLSGWLLLSMLGVGILGGASLSVRAAPVQQAATNIVISEFRTTGPGGGNDEFIELYNPTLNPVDISSWQISGSNATGSTSIRVTIPSTPLLQPGQYFLIANSNGYSGTITQDVSYTTGITDTGGIALLNGGTIVDAVGMNLGSAYFEGTPLPSRSSTQNHSYERKLGGVDGNCIDFGDNSKDFIYHNGSVGNISNPQNSTSPTVSCGIPTAPLIEVLINEVAWAGTLASSDDEWIELYNPSLTNTINISGWRLVAESGNVDVIFPAGTVIPPDSYFLMERAREEVTNASSNMIYFGALSDTGEILRLRRTDGTIVDTANSDGGSWPAGLTTTNSMERMGILADVPLSWVTNVNTSSWSNSDAAFNPVRGTPGRANWGFGITHTPIPTSTFTPSPSPTPPPTAPLTIVISEVAWAGTLSSSDDEWIELYNPGTKDINLTGWNLRSSDGSPNIQTEFDGIIIKADDYILLERTDDDVTDVDADVLYTGSLSNSGEILRLYDPNGNIVDTANSNGGRWPAGISSTYSSMQRSLIATDSDYVWVTYDAARDGLTVKDKDASGNDIKGTPRRGNTPFNVTPTPTPRTNTGGGNSGSGGSTVVVSPILGISEFLPRPGYDWNNDGIVDVFDEFIEIINAGSVDVNLSAYRVDDEENLGSSPYTLPSLTLKPGERAVFYASETGILLSDAGDTVRLLRGSTVVDAYTYSVVGYPDQSWCRIPDRLGYWNDPCFPTPGNPNSLTGTIPLPSGPLSGYRPRVCLLPDTTPDEFVYAECEAGGDEIWSRQYWDRADASERLKLDEAQKWETVFE